MQAGFKYPIDEEVLRSKLLHTSSANKEQAWEKFEQYLSQQQPVFPEPKKKHLALMIPPQLLLRGVLACLIILPTLLFYRHFNTSIPAALQKARHSANVSKIQHNSVKPAQQVLNLSSISPVHPLTEPAEASSTALPAQAQSTKPVSKKDKPLKTISSADSAHSSVAVPVLPTSPENKLEASAEKTLLPQPEQTGELNEQL